MTNSNSNIQSLQQKHKYITEIIFLLHSTAEFLSTVTLRSNIPQIACLNLYQEINLCNHLENSSNVTVVDEVQLLAAKYMMYTKCLSQTPSIVLILYWGAWSDRYGRNVPMLLPPKGMILSTAMYMAANFLPRYSFICIILGSSINGIAGDTSLFVMTLFSYVTDVTDSSERHLRFGLLKASQNFGRFFGAFIAGMLLGTTHTNVSYGMALILYVIVVIAVCLLQENRPTQTDNEFASTGLKNLRDSTMVLLKKRQLNFRRHVCILLLVLLLNQLCIYGTLDVFVLYTELPPLSLHPSWFGYLVAYDNAIKGMIIIIIMPLLPKMGNVPELIISMVGSIFTSLYFLLLTWSKTMWMLCVAVTVGTLRCTIVSPIKSVLSQCVGKNEIGKIFALLGSGETLAKTFGLIFPALYSFTLDVCPGCAFLLASAIYVTMALLSLYVHLNVKNSLSNPEECETTLKESSDSYDTHSQ